VLKGRLAKALRLEGITDLGLANERLARAILPMLNRRFHRGGGPIPTGDNRAGDDARSWRVASPRRARDPATDHRLAAASPSVSNSLRARHQPDVTGGMAHDWVTTTSQIPRARRPVTGRHIDRWLGMAPSYAQAINAVNPGGAANAHAGMAQLSRRSHENGNPGEVGELPTNRPPTDLGGWRIRSLSSPVPGPFTRRLPASLQPQLVW
jgi:hypothetical protein